MKTRKPTQTESTYSTNKEVDRLEGKTINQRSGLVKDISTTFYDIDYAIKWHIENVIKCTITEKNSIITVPVIFASGEKWAAIQKHGHLRDNQGKILTPLIVIRRNSVSRRDDIQELKVLETPENRIIFEKKYTQQNKYDRFSVTRKPVSKEYYSVDIPKFFQLEYDLLVWVNNTIQLNEIVEQLLWFDGKAFGDTHKFITHIDPPSFESANQVGEDRIIRATMMMRTKARLLSSYGPNAPIMYKLNPVNRIIMSLEVDSGISDIFGTQSDFAQEKEIVVIGSAITPGSGTSAKVDPTILAYLNTSKQLTGTVVSNTEVEFGSSWMQAPSSLPITSIDNFIFFVNGVLLEKSAIVSFNQVNGKSVLTINESLLGYSLSSSDEVVGVGKFINSDDLA